MTPSRARRETRILKSSEYRLCQAAGKRMHSRHFCLLACFRPGATGRYGMAVSRKIGNAVARNRVKRLLREFFRHNLAALSGWDVVAVAKQEAHLLALRDVEAELEPLLRKLETSQNA